ncbi:hypothetical protein K0U27_02115 [archaeon]|nr:hypothetical protein [archaeon]
MSSEITETLGSCIDKAITIKLRNKKTIQRNLLGFDQWTNLIIGNSNDAADLNQILVRGDNILVILLPDACNSSTPKDGTSI